MRILIIDDHPLTCQGLAALLSSGSADEPVQRQVRSAHSAADARAALATAAHASEGPFDWIFLDVRLPDDPQQTLFAELCASPWVMHTLLISAEAPRELLRQALGAGMRGFIPKAADPAMVLAGFDAVRRGGVYLPPDLLDLLKPAPPEAAGRSLSPRLREVLALVLRGASNKVIARECGLSEYTVKEYMSSILAYHGVTNRLELVLKLKGGATGLPTHHFCGNRREV